MDKIKTVKELNSSILLLENRQAQELIVLKDQYELTYESLKPLNILKSTFKELVTAPDFKENLINASVSLGAGFLSKKVTVGSTNNPFKKIFGNFLQMGVTKVVSNNMDGIKEKASDALRMILKKMKT